MMLLSPSVPTQPTCASPPPRRPPTFDAGAAPAASSECKDQLRVIVGRTRAARAYLGDPEAAAHVPQNLPQDAATNRQRDDTSRAGVAVHRFQMRRVSAMRIVTGGVSVAKSVV